MEPLDLDAIASLLRSPQSRDRLQGLAHLRHVDAAQAFPLVVTVLYDLNLPVRSYAIALLAENPTPECYNLLLDLMRHDPDYAARADAAAALGVLGQTEAIDALVQAFNADSSWLVQFSAIVSLGNLQDLRAQSTLQQALTHPVAIVQMAAISALGELGDRESVDLLLEFVASDDWFVRQRLAGALGNLPTEKSIAALKYLQKDTNAHVAQTADFAIAQIQDHPDSASGS
ncbi:MAG TPA: HEAT repeat domain-containing protein [Stenomitos sp.]